MWTIKIQLLLYTNLSKINIFKIKSPITIDSPTFLQFFPTDQPKLSFYQKSWKIKVCKYFLDFHLGNFTYYYTISHPFISPNHALFPSFFPNFSPTFFPRFLNHTFSIFEIFSKSCLSFFKNIKHFSIIKSNITKYNCA